MFKILFFFVESIHQEQYQLPSENKTKGQLIFGTRLRCCCCFFFLHGCESWTPNAEAERRIQAF
jgi:hypothetical protein